MTLFQLQMIPAAWCADKDTDSWVDDLAAGFSTDTKILSYGQYFHPADSDQNPDNRFINFPTYTVTGEIRNETSLHFDWMELDASPRLAYEWQKWESDAAKGQSGDDYELYLIYGRVRFVPFASLYLSYGRENLQWGPSFLYSPSNPFFKDNGKQNPRLEIEGMEFFRAVWLPSFDWTVSLIYHDSYGRSIESSRYFSKAVALKTDFVGEKISWGTIFYGNEEEHLQVGAYTGLVANEAMLLYGEGALVYGNGALYPVSSDHPLGYDLTSLYEKENRWQPNILFGSSYTFTFGPTLVMEYLYYGQGYDKDQIIAFNTLRKRARDAFLAQNQATPLAAATLGFTADPGLRFLRRNYAMLQLNQSEIRDFLDYSLRWTANLDDGSSQLTATCDFYITDPVTLFLVSTINFGRNNSELVSFLKNYAMVGLEYHF